MSNNIYAAIDVGSNSIGLLVADVSAAAITPVFKEIIITRLAGGVDAQGSLSEAAMARSIEAIVQLTQMARGKSAKEIYAFATSAVRDAKNAQDFCNRVEETGIPLEIISGAVEAQLGFDGTIAGRKGPFGIIDIGGGSTELAWGHAGEMTGRHSFQLGVVRAMDRFSYGDKPDTSILQNMDEWIAQTFQAETSIPNDNAIQWLAIGGTATSLGAVHLAMEDYDPARIEGRILDRPTIAALSNHFDRLSLQERQALPGLLPERADVIVAGAHILLAAMDRVCTSSLMLSDRGNKDGYLLYLRDKGTLK